MVKERIKAADKIDPPVVLVCNSKLKKWAWENGYSLIFLSILFIITWGVTILAQLIH